MVGGVSTPGYNG